MLRRGAQHHAVWADHADSIAKAYGGSGALKSDFTRTNKRTKKGLLEDGAKSIIRYLKNNYFDGPRQDGFDLVTGTWIPRKGPASSLFLVTDARPLVTRAVSAPLAATVSCLKFSGSRRCLLLFVHDLRWTHTPAHISYVFESISIARSHLSTEYSLFYYFLLWFTLLAVAVTYMMINGIDFVSWPKLLPPTDLIYYNGPGFRSARHGMGLRGGKDLKVAVGKTAKWLNGGKLRVRQNSKLDEGDIPLGVLKKRVD